MFTRLLATAALIAAPVVSAASGVHGSAEMPA
jgi:hypothetical protein